MNKTKVKSTVVLFGIFLSGMLSVTIANFFGGFYCSVAAITIILSTLYVFDVLDRRAVIEEKTNLLMVGLITFLEVLFFVVNDIIGYNVYVKGNLDFMGGLVVVSQFYSIFAIIYYLIKIDIALLKNKSSVEIVDDYNRLSNEHKEVESNVNNDNINEEINSTVDSSNVEDIRQIPRNEVDVETPYMDEEK